jgi:hypothetical protein
MVNIKMVNIKNAVARLATGFGGDAAFRLSHL